MFKRFAMGAALFGLATLVPRLRPPSVAAAGEASCLPYDGATLS